MGWLLLFYIAFGSNGPSSRAEAPVPFNTRYDESDWYFNYRNRPSVPSSSCEPMWVQEELSADGSVALKNFSTSASLPRSGWVRVIQVQENQSQDFQERYPELGGYPRKVITCGGKVNSQCQCETGAVKELDYELILGDSLQPDRVIKSNSFFSNRRILDREVFDELYQKGSLDAFFRKAPHCTNELEPVIAGAILGQPLKFPEDYTRLKLADSETLARCIREYDSIFSNEAKGAIPKNTEFQPKTDLESLFDQLEELDQFERVFLQPSIRFSKNSDLSQRIMKKMKQKLTEQGFPLMADAFQKVPEIANWAALPAEDRWAAIACSLPSVDHSSSCGTQTSATNETIPCLKSSAIQISAIGLQQATPVSATGCIGNRISPELKEELMAYHVRRVLLDRRGTQAVDSPGANQGGEVCKGDSRLLSPQGVNLLFGCSASQAMGQDKKTGGTHWSFPVVSDYRYEKGKLIPSKMRKYEVSTNAGGTQANYNLTLEPVPLDARTGRPSHCQRLETPDVSALWLASRGSAICDQKILDPN